MGALDANELEVGNAGFENDACASAGSRTRVENRAAKLRAHLFRDTPCQRSP